MEDRSQTVTIMQRANLGIVLPKQVFDLQSGANNIDVEVQANVQYAVSTSVDWIKQTGTKGLTSKTLTFSIEENKAYDSREGKIIVKPLDSSAQEQVISVRQAQKDALIVEKTSYDMPYGGGEIEIKVESNVLFEAVPTAKWIHHVQTKALNNSTIALKIDENTTFITRQGAVEIKQLNGILRYTITITQAGRIEVSSVELDKTSIRINVGNMETLVATVKPDNATDKTVTWTSSDNATVTVDEAGKITGIKEGTATITAKASNKTAECKVSVCIPVSSVELDKAELALKPGETTTLTATVKPDNATNKTVTWSSSDSGIASVDETGKVIAITEGTATITVKAEEKTAECKVTVFIPVTSIELDKTELALNPGETATLVATIKPDNATDKTVIWTSSDSSIASVDNTGKVTAVKEGSVSISAKAGDKSTTCSVLVETVPEGAVDLGIIMTRADGSEYRLFWAKCNIGASKPEEYGDYFAWGETQSSYSYTLITYKWAANGPNYKLTKYCPKNKTDYWDGTGSPDGKTVLDLEDDVAHVKLGGNWRMPTDAEWIELSKNCTWTWTAQNGVSGRLVTSKKNGNSIFLPAAGECLGPNPSWLGLCGSYWSSSLNTDVPDNAWRVFFSSDEGYPGILGGVHIFIDTNRFTGISVRPVTE